MSDEYLLLAFRDNSDAELFQRETAELTGKAVYVAPGNAEVQEVTERDGRVCESPVSRFVGECGHE